MSAAISNKFPHWYFFIESFVSAALWPVATWLLLAPQRRASPGQSPSGGRDINLTADQAEVADGLYGQPNSADYIADQGERYRHYWENMEKRRAQGRL